MKKFNFDEIKDFIDRQTPETKIYVGCDSERFRINDVWMADYSLAIVVHIDGSRGCKIFGEIHRERDYDQKRDKPRMRLMTEVMKIADLYIKLYEVLGDREIVVHLDLNTDLIHGSSCVVNEAIGYIRGMCNVIPLVKPEAFAASYCADRMKMILAEQQRAA